jgi:hypothetical protein
MVIGVEAKLLSIIQVRVSPEEIIYGFFSRGHVDILYLFRGHGRFPEGGQKGVVEFDICLKGIEENPVTVKDIPGKHLKDSFERDFENCVFICEVSVA